MNNQNEDVKVDTPRDGLLYDIHFLDGFIKKLMYLPILEYRPKWDVSFYEGAVAIRFTTGEPIYKCEGGKWKKI